MDNPFQSVHILNLSYLLKFSSCITYIFQVHESTLDYLRSNFIQHALKNLVYSELISLFKNPLANIIVLPIII